MFHIRVLNLNPNLPLADLHIRTGMFEVADDCIIVTLSQESLDELETAVANAQRAIHE